MKFPESTYRFTTTWHLQGSLQDVLPHIANITEWPIWWKGVVEAKILEPGANDGVGMVIQFAWRSIFPYTLHFIGTTTEVKIGEYIKGTAKGDLNGIGIWHFSEEGSTVTATYDWQVSTSKPWMNALAPIARPFFAYAHDHLMKAGEKGLQALLDQRAMPSEQ